MAGPRIQGHYYDFSSCEFILGPLGVVANIQDINYNQKLDPGPFRGSGSKIRGRTRGTYDADGDFTLYKEDYMALIALLLKKSRGGGYMTVPFGITVMYRELEAPTVVDTLRGCRIVSEGHSLSSGNNAAVVKVGLSVMELLLNGMPAVTGNGPAPNIPGLQR